MQNLFVKFLVLSSVIGSSCFVVWQAHDGLKSAADKMDPAEFVALPEKSATESEQATPDWNQAIDLSGNTEEPVPTLAAAPEQSEPEQSESELPAEPEIPESRPFGPAAMAASETAARKPIDKNDVASETSGLPLFFNDVPRSSTANPMPSSPSAASVPSETGLTDNHPVATHQEAEEHGVEPLPTPAGLASKPDAASREFVDLPGQRVELMSNEVESPVRLPQAEPLPNIAQEKLPQPSGAAEMPTSPFDPLAGTNESPDVSSTPGLTPVRKMPGLTQLPSSQPSPVPLSTEETPVRPDRNVVVNAGGFESDPSPIQRTSGTVLPLLPDEKTSGTSREAEITKAAGQSPEKLPNLESMLRKTDPKPITITKSETAGAEAADPFGMTELPAAPAANSEALPSAAPPDSEPVPTPTSRQAPGLFPGVLPANAGITPEAPALRTREVPVQPGILQAGGEQAAPSMPPLPPMGEVLPFPGDSTRPAEPVPTRAAPINPLSENPVPENPLSEHPVPANPLSGNSMPDTIPSGHPLEMPTANSRTSPVLPDVLPDVLPEISQSPAQQSEDQMEVLPDLPPVTPIPTPSLTPPAVPDVGNTLSLPSSPAALPAMAPAGEHPDLSQSHLLGTADPDMTAPQGVQSPELKIEKIAPPEAEVGQPVIYAIIIRNVGGSAARDVEVEDRIPRGARLEGTIPQAYLSEGKLTWQLGTIESGDERKIQLKVTPIEAGQIGSVATVSFEASASASIKVNAPKLTIGMQGPKESTFGEPMNFRFTLKNVGNSPAKSVILRAVLPAGLKHPGGNDLEYESGLLAAGEEKTVDLVVQAEKADHYTILSQVTNDGKLHAETRGDVNVIKSRLELARTGPENRFVGRMANFTLKISNTSADVLKGITIQEKLADGIDLPAIPGGGHWDPRTRLITWRLDQLQPSESREININYLPKKTGEHHGKLMAMDEAGNRCALDTNMNVKGFSELTPTYQVDQRTVLVNERISLQMTLKNAGTASSHNIRAQFILPDGVEFVSARGPEEYQVTGQQVIFTPLRELPVDGTETFHLAVIATRAGTAKITLKLEADDYTEPLFQDQAIRVVSTGE